MLSLPKIACEQAQVGTMMHCFYDDILSILEPVGRSVFLPACACNQCIQGVRLYHACVSDCKHTHEAVQAVYRSMGLQQNDVLENVELMEQLAFLTNENWQSGKDLLIVVGSDTQRVCLHWSVPILKDGDCKYIPLLNHGLLVSNFFLGPTPVVFETLSDLELESISPEFELMWYCKALAVACKIKHIVSIPLNCSQSYPDMDTLYFYNLNDLQSTKKNEF